MSGYQVFCGPDVGKDTHHATARDTAGHLASYAGLAPVTRRSGSSIRGEHPNRGGNKHLKNAMLMAAFAAPRDPDSRAYYDRKRAAGKKHNAALVCLARRRCDVLYATLRHHTPTSGKPPQRLDKKMGTPPSRQVVSIRNARFVGSGALGE